MSDDVVKLRSAIPIPAAFAEYFGQLHETQEVIAKKMREDIWAALDRMQYPRSDLLYVTNEDDTLGVIDARLVPIEYEGGCDCGCDCCGY